MIPELASALRKAGLAVDWRELADIVWLIRAQVAHAAETETKPTANAEPVPSSWEEPGPPDAVSRFPSPDQIPPPQSPLSSPEVPSAPKPLRAASTVGRILTTGQVSGDAVADLSAVAPRRFALPRRRELERAIRPLIRRQRSSRRRELDLAATVDHYCDTELLVPLLRRQEEPWLDVSLITDSGPSMTIWQDTCRAFGDLLERSGAFRHVGRWSIDASGGGFALTTPTGLLHPDVGGRTLVLVLTDGMSPRWAETEVWQALKLWGKWSPTAILQLLSGSAADLTTLGEAELAATARAAATPSARLQFDYPWWIDETGTEAASTVEVVPLVSLTPGRLAAWARLVTGAVGAEVDAVVAGPRDAPPDGGLLPADDEAARDLLNTSLSPRTRRLGVLLSTVHLSLDLVRIVMERLIPDADISDLAHLIAIDALVFKEDSLAFAPVAQRYFHDLVTAPDALDVWIAVAPYLEAIGGRSPFSLLYEEDRDAVADLPGTTIPLELVERLGLARKTSAPALREALAAPSPSTAEQVRTEPDGSMRLDVKAPVSAMDCLVTGGRLVAVARTDTGTVRAWDLTLRRPFGPQPTDWDVVDAGPIVCTHQRDRPIALTAGHSGSVLLWALGSSHIEDLASGKSEDFAESVFSTGPQPDSRITALGSGMIEGRPFVVSGHADGGLWVWDLSGSAKGGSVIGQSTSAYKSLVWASLDDGPCLLSADSEGGMTVWALQVAEAGLSARVTWKAPARDVITCLAVTEHEGRPLFVTGAGNAIEVWDAATGSLVRPAFKGHLQAVTAIASCESNSGGVIVSGDASGHLIAWDLASGVTLQVGLQDHTEHVTSIVCIREDDRVVIVSAGADGVIRRHPTLDLGERASGAEPDIDFTPLESGGPLVLSITSTFSDGDEVLDWRYVDRGETVFERSGTPRTVRRRLAEGLGSVRSRTQLSERATETVLALRRIIPPRLWPHLREITPSREVTLVLTTDLTGVPWHLLPRDKKSTRWESSLGWRSPVTVVPGWWTNPYQGHLLAEDFVVLLPPPESQTLSSAQQEGVDLASAYPVRPVFATDEGPTSPVGHPQVIHAAGGSMGSLDLRWGPLVFVNVGSTADLATKLLEAGARAVVAPLWAVNAKAARRVAERFYAHVASGSTTAHALTQVRAEMANESYTVSKTVLAFQHFGDPSLTIEFPPPTSSDAFQTEVERTLRLVAPSRPPMFAAALLLDLGTDSRASQQVDDIVRWLVAPEGANVDEDVRVIRAPTGPATVTAAIDALLGTSGASRHKPLFLLVNGSGQSARGDDPVLVFDDAPDEPAVRLRDIVLRLAGSHPGGVLAVSQAGTLPHSSSRRISLLEVSPQQPAPWMLVHWPTVHPRLSTITWAIDDLRSGARATGDVLLTALRTPPENRGQLKALHEFAETLEGSAPKDDDAVRETRAEVQARIWEIGQKHEREGFWGDVTVQGFNLQRLVFTTGNEYEQHPLVTSAAPLELHSGDFSPLVIDRLGLREKLRELVQLRLYNVLVVNGPAGSGKTFAARMLEHLASQTGLFEVFVVDLASTPGITPLAVVGMLSRSMDSERRLVPPPDGDLYALALWVVQEFTASDRTMVWVLDGIDALGVSPRMKEFARRLALVVSQEPRSSLALVLLDFDDQSNELRNSGVAWEQLSGIEPDDVRAFLETSAVQMRTPMSDEVLDEATRQLMSGLPAGPERLAILSERVWRWAGSAAQR
ncbi:hypothetical protein AU252_11455 [Pseudarthrobacter sulfonivorans]|uniref:CHAT domain-containing protein n=1 Tax=Pseudarthrobacter sulfonivorans TaxID=121292 RepID=A0A0U3Q900_9MICC|nr:SAV_2336 N-terminal domain-related protein [Pseudarthrobacter sulfonivorans]ALV41690.1 hypothetical protein AU252_11455 [Pseudarthrobacter sulfonivorans]